MYDARHPNSEEFMNRNHVFAIGFFAVIALCGSPVAAQLNRTAVSINGVDGNPCTPASPCRTFSYALTQTNAGGEVVAIDSGGYGPFSITKSVTVLAAPGVHAGVTASSADAIVINAGASDKVIIRGLTLSGLGTGNSGISSTGGASEVYVENCVIDGFLNYGIISFLNIRILDTVIRNCGTGIWVDNAGSVIKATIDHVQVTDISGGSAVLPGVGILCWRNTTMLVRNSLVAYASSRGLYAQGGGKLNIENCFVVNNGTGIEAAETGTLVRVSNTMTAANDIGWSNSMQSGFESFGNNKTRGNTTDIGGTGVIPIVPQS
jgi:hypothetical protein